VDEKFRIINRWDESLAVRAKKLRRLECAY
jgi:hypothetical protein